MSFSREEKIHALQNWMNTITQVNDHISTLDKAFGQSVEGANTQTFFMACDALSQATAKIVEDQNEWLDWFQFENEMGERSYQVSWENGPIIHVETLDDLLDVIEEDNKRIAKRDPQ